MLFPNELLALKKIYEYEQAHGRMHSDIIINLLSDIDGEDYAKELYRSLAYKKMIRAKKDIAVSGGTLLWYLSAVGRLVLKREAKRGS